MCREGGVNGGWLAPSGTHVTFRHALSSLGSAGQNQPGAVSALLVWRHFPVPQSTGLYKVRAVLAVLIWLYCTANLQVRTVLAV